MATPRRFRCFEPRARAQPCRRRVNQSPCGVDRKVQAAIPVNRSGYRLDDVLVDGQVDLAKLLVGSEGTLALVTEATLTVDRLPAHRGCVVCYSTA